MCGLITIAITITIAIICFFLMLFVALVSEFTPLPGPVAINKEVVVPRHRTEERRFKKMFILFYLESRRFILKKMRDR